MTCQYVRPSVDVAVFLRMTSRHTSPSTFTQIGMSSDQLLSTPDRNRSTFILWPWKWCGAANTNLKTLLV
jgi:hypothetical protein